MNLKPELDNILENIDSPEQGLPEELFTFATKITPMINVDLLVRNSEGEILLSWRKTDLSEGWHVIGGIIRLNEKIEERIQKTALNEIGSEVIYKPSPAAVKEIINRDLPYRTHFITLVYECRLPDGFVINNNGKTSDEPGYLKWHKTFPKNMISCHRFYKEFFN